MKDTVFQQIMKPLTTELMNRCSKHFQSDYDCETFDTSSHVRTMIYAHLTNIKSLRTLEVAINSQKIGLKTRIKRSTLSDANRRRTADCFFWLLKHLMSLLPQKRCRGMKKFIKLLDSTPIQLKGQGYDEWAKEYSTYRCQGLKLHMEYDLAHQAPTRCAISYPNYTDTSMGQHWPVKTDTIYVFDKGYYDFNWWWSIQLKDAFFVTRLKKNAAILLQSNKEGVTETILEEGTFVFKNKRPRAGKINVYEKPLRRISVKVEGKKPLILVTNLFDCPADKIAALYKARWEIELFFKWIKQNLKLTTFLGKSANAVKIQIATALMAYLLVQLFKTFSCNNCRLQLVLVWVRFNLSLRKQKIRCHSPPVYHFQRASLNHYQSVFL